MGNTVLRWKAKRHAEILPEFINAAIEGDTHKMGKYLKQGFHVDALDPYQQLDPYSTLDPKIYQSILQEYFIDDVRTIQ